MNETAEIWEFIDKLPSRTRVKYRLERHKRTRSSEVDLLIDSDDPDFPVRLSKYSGQKVLAFLAFLLNSGGAPIARSDIERELWPDEGAGIADTYVSTLRKLLNDDSKQNRRGQVLRGRIIESLSGGSIRFVPDVTRPPTTHERPLPSFISPPPLVNYVNRPELLNALVGELTSNTTGSLLVTVLQGEGGMGKTTLALAACRDDRVQAAFPDGIIWLPRGSEPKESIEQWLDKIALQPNCPFPGSSREAYQSVLQGKAVLLVLDDVWTPQDTEQFLFASSGSRLLLTTRDRRLAKAFRATPLEVGMLTAKDARRFLEYWSAPGSTPPEPYATKIIAECGGMALALAMVVASLRNGEERDWKRLLANFRTARLRHIEQPLLNYEHQTLHAAIAVSIDALPADIRARYASLAVLLPGMSAPPLILQALWGQSEDDVQNTNALLIDRSLARYDADGLRLHDLQLKYLWSEYPHPESLTRIHAALRRSYHVIRRYPEQFFPEMAGRLMAYTGEEHIAEFVSRWSEYAPRPRLRPVWASLNQADDASQVQFETEALIGRCCLADNRERAFVLCYEGIIAWDLNKNSLLNRLEPDGYIDAIACDRDGRRVIFGCSPRDQEGWDAKSVLVVWDIDNDQAPRSLEGHRGKITCVAMSGDGKIAVSAAEDGSVILWDLHGQDAPKSLKRGTKAQADATLERLSPIGLSGYPCAVALSTDGHTVVCGLHEGKFVIWSRDEQRSIRLSALPQDVQEATADARSNINIVLAADGHHALVRCGFDEVLVWDLRSNKLARRLVAPAGAQCMAASANADVVAVGTLSGQLLLFSNADQNEPRIIRRHDSAVVAIALARDGGTALSCDANGTAIFWHLDGEPATQQTGTITLLSISQKEKKVTASYDPVDHDPRLSVVTPDRRGHIEFKNAGPGGFDIIKYDDDDKVKKRRHFDDGTVTAITAVDDRRFAAAVRRDNDDDDEYRPPEYFIIISDFEEISSVRTLAGHWGTINCLAMMPDGRHLASASDDCSVMVWNVKYGGVPLTKFVFDVAVSFCACAQGYVAVGDSCGVIHLLALDE